jgi:hypothetical protein
MKTKRRVKRSRSRACARQAARLAAANEMKRLSSHLDALITGSGRSRSQIQEQLRQCPEAFKAGEAIEKLFNTGRFDGEEQADCERFLPPPGTTIPPFA